MAENKNVNAPVEATEEEQLIESEILRVKYQQLKAQVNPHFLFNSLNILTSLINSNPHKATEFTKKLASIYRYLLSNDKQDVVLLSEELKFAQQYAQILNIRYGEGIKINIPQATDVSILSMRIIPTALQILIENACKHNIISTTDPLTINIVPIPKKEFFEVTNTTRFEYNAQRISKTRYFKGLKEKYTIIANKEIKIKQTDTIFSVSIPLLTRHEIA